VPTQAEVAAHLDLGDARYVRELRDDGKIPDPRSASLDEIRVAYIRGLRAAAAGHVSADGTLDLTAERARLAKEQADAQELKNAVTRGALVDAEEVAGGWVAVATAIRTRMLAVPVRVSHELAEATEPSECHGIVDRAIREILEELADAKIVAPRTGRRRQQEERTAGD